MIEPLEIAAEIHAAMVAHCVRDAPIECCGVLGGSGRLARSIHPFRNVRESETRFEADPMQVIAAVRDLRSRGEGFVAIYHSHPRWKAVPSGTDLERNGYGDLPQVIVGLLGPEPEVRAWRLSTATYDEIPILVVDRPVEREGHDR